MQLFLLLLMLLCFSLPSILTFIFTFRLNVVSLLGIKKNMIERQKDIAVTPVSCKVQATNGVSGCSTQTSLLPSSSYTWMIPDRPYQKYKQKIKQLF